MPWQRIGARALLAVQVLFGIALAAFCVLLLGLGVGLITAGVDHLTNASSLRSSADGTVVAHWQEHDSRDARTERIQVRFTSADGSPHVFSEVGRAKTGDRIRVHYKDGDPANASVHSATSNRFVAALGAFVGLAMVVAVLGLLARGGWELTRVLRRRVRRPLPVD